MEQISLEQVQHLAGVQSMLQSWSWQGMAAVGAVVALWMATSWAMFRLDWSGAIQGSGTRPRWLVMRTAGGAMSSPGTRLTFLGCLGCVVCLYLAAVCQVHVKLDLSERPLLAEVLKARESLDPGFDWKGDEATGAQMAQSRQWLQGRVIQVVELGSKLRMAGKFDTAAMLEADMRALRATPEDRS